MMLSFYSTPPKKLNVCLHFNHISQHTTQVTTPFCKKRFEKGIFAKIYLFASERLLVYLLPILSQIQKVEAVKEFHGVVNHFINKKRADKT